MTTIIIHKGDLYGDRKVMIESLPLSFYNRAKIFTSSCGQFGFAMEDPGVDPDNPLPQEKVVRRLLERITIKPPRASTSVVDILGLKLSELAADPVAYALTGDVAVITRTMSFATRHGKVRELQGRDFGQGADHWTLLGLIHAGKSVEDAYAWIGKHCPMTGGVCDVIRHETLLPFVVQGVS